ncbi:hypothetical protein, partial [Pseudomonas viridiflava]|uniref:hypothetical protein n=1 Tax=Pseudomonas viridiflava TaxID=33069 RepID=UPI00197EA9DF
VLPKEALRLASESVRTAEAMLGPEATKGIGVALNALKNAIELAVIEWLKACPMLSILKP